MHILPRIFSHLALAALLSSALSSCGTVGTVKGWLGWEDDNQVAAVGEGDDIETADIPDMARRGSQVDLDQMELKSLDQARLGGVGRDFKVDPALAPYLREAAKIAESEGEQQAAANHWGAAWSADESNVEAAIGFVRHLRMAGSGGAAVRIAKKSLVHNPDDRSLQLEYGKSLIVAGRGGEAEKLLQKMLAQEPGNPELILTYGLSLDAQGRHADAYRVYQQSMRNNTATAELLNNAAMSRAIVGDLETAQQLLERALDEPDGNLQMQQNLAFVLWLRGDVARSEKITRQALPPEMAEKTLAFYREFSNQRDVWGEHNPSQ